MINQRLFGSPISGKVKEELERRQQGETLTEGEFGESLNVTGNNGFNLNERTPFARMWTSVKFIQPERVAEVYKEFNVNDDEGSQISEVKAKLYSNENPGTQVIPIKDNSELDVLGRPKIIKYIVKTPGDDERGAREKVDFARKIYVIGDYNYQESADKGTTNSLQIFDSVSLNGMSGIGVASQNDVDALFPNQLKNNELIKPQTGITSINTETEGTLGVIKRTTVNFVVHNFDDFDKIYNKYFLKPGATVFVDFGWSSVENLYNPLDLITSDNIKEYLYGSKDVPGYEDDENQESIEVEEKIGFITENQGYVDVIQGIVVDYNAKILENGSVECSITLTSSNNALLGQETNEIVVRQIQNVLYEGALYLGIQSTLSEIEESEDEISDTKEFFITPNKDDSAEDLDTYNKKLQNLAKKQLGSTNFGLTPSGNAIRTGVFIDSLNVDDVYVCWGFVEDIIINEKFGFGSGTKNIKDGNNLQVRMDSSNSFTTWNKVFEERQKTLANVPESTPNFLYPEWWGNSDPDGDSVELDEGIRGTSYSYFNNKYPKLFYNSDSQTDEDIKKNRIPIREVFINADMILGAFRRNNTIRKVINDLLGEINKSSDGVFDWKMISGETDSELIIIDNNRVDIQQRINDSGQSNIENQQDAFVEMFQFNIMSPNSIVKDYNLEFSLPEGNIGNMYAVQGMSHENKLFPLSNQLDDALAINSLDVDALSIVYEPDNSGFRANQIDTNENRDGELNDVFENAKLLISDDIYKTSAIRSDEQLESILTSYTSENLDDSPELTEDEKKKQQQRLIKINIDRLNAQGFRVVSDFTNYYKVKEIQEVVLKTRPNLLPFTLSLTTYGISSIQPGDTFRVDYLPQMYLDNVYLQVMKVSHGINSDGWFTTLDTQFRPRPEVKESHYIDINTDKVRLSPKVLHNLDLKVFYYVEERNYIVTTIKTRKKLKITELTPYITDLKIYTKNFNNIGLVLSFKTTSLSDSLKNNLRFYNYAISRFNLDAYQKLKDKYEIIYISDERGGVEEGNDASTTTGLRTTHITPPAITLNSNTNYYIVIQNQGFFITDSENMITDFDFPTSQLRFG